MRIDALMPYKKFEPIPTSISSYDHFFNVQLIPCTIAHGFFKKWFRNHPKFLLHFLIHIDVLMLCRKFELILTSIFRVTAILRNRPKSENYPRL